MKNETLRENKCDRASHHSEPFCLPAKNSRRRNKLAVCPKERGSSDTPSNRDCTQLSPPYHWWNPSIRRLNNSGRQLCSAISTWCWIAIGPIQLVKVKSRSKEIYRHPAFSTKEEERGAIVAKTCRVRQPRVPLSADNITRADAPEYNFLFIYNVNYCKNLKVRFKH